jgi:hypothetical protein
MRETTEGRVRTLVWLYTSPGGSCATAAKCALSTTCTSSLWICVSAEAEDARTPRDVRQPVLARCQAETCCVCRSDYDPRSWYRVDSRCNAVLKPSKCHCHRTGRWKMNQGAPRIRSIPDRYPCPIPGRSCESYRPLTECPARCHAYSSP